MTKFLLPLPQLIHKNLSIIMDHIFSRVQLEQFVANRFVGEWKYLNKALFDYSELRVQKACFEIAIYMRLHDDVEHFNQHLIDTKHPGFGRLVLKDDTEKPLTLRDCCNKIIHATYIQWDLSTADNPVLICNSEEPERWIRAEINFIAFATFCGQLQS